MAGLGLGLRGGFRIEGLLAHTDGAWWWKEAAGSMLMPGWCWPVREARGGCGSACSGLRSVRLFRSFGPGRGLSGPLGSLIRFFKVWGRAVPGEMTRDKTSRSFEA